MTAQVAMIAVAERWLDTPGLAAMLRGLSRPIDAGAAGEVVGRRFDRAAPRG